MPLFSREEVERWRREREGRELDHAQAAAEVAGHHEETQEVVDEHHWKIDKKN